MSFPNGPLKSQMLIEWNIFFSSYFHRGRNKINVNVNVSVRIPIESDRDDSHGQQKKISKNNSIL